MGLLTRCDQDGACFAITTQLSINSCLATEQSRRKTASSESHHWSLHQCFLVSIVSITDSIVSVTATDVISECFVNTASSQFATRPDDAKQH